MKIAAIFQTIVLFASTAAIATRAVPAPKREREARCVVAGYPTYSATVIAVGSNAKTHPVTLRVDKLYAGSASVGTEVVRDYTEPSPELETDARDAWQGVLAHLGDRVLIIERGDGPSVIAAEPDASPTATNIRELTQLNKRAAAEPKLLLNRVASLQPNADPLETAFVIEAAFTRLPPDVAVEALTTLMKKTGFTTVQRMDLSVSFGLVWFHCTAEGKASSMDRLTRLAASADFEKARFPLNQLLLIRSQVPVVLPTLNPAEAQRLWTNYEKLVTQGPRRDAAFEAYLKHAGGSK